MPVDGSAGADTLYAPTEELNEAVLSPDGRWLVVRTAPGGTYHRDIFAVDLAGDRTLIPMAVGPTTSEQMPRLSPDGRHVSAYGAGEARARAMTGLSVMDLTNGSRISLQGAGSLFLPHMGAESSTIVAIAG